MRYVKNMQFDPTEVSDVYIERFAKDFIDRSNNTLKALCFSAYKDNGKVSMDAFREMVFEEVKTALYSFANNSKNPKFVEAYLFAVIHKLIKAMNNETKRNVYVCPACRYMSKLEILTSTSSKLVCNGCKNALNNTKHKWEDKFYSTFAEHNKKGFVCGDCENFIPDNGKEIVSCPYPKCIFVGNTNSLKGMRHPHIKANMEISTENDLFQDNRSLDAELVIKDDINRYLEVLNECIDAQINLLHYKCNNSTIVSRLCMYNAFRNMVDQYPNEMISSLVLLNRNTKFQHKIFQEFVRLLEEKIPFTYESNKKHYIVSSLLDDNLCIFDGISEFNATISEKFEIPNLTQELYIGSRSGYYCRPYYIGKVIEVRDIDSNVEITNHIKQYDFFKIVMNKEAKIGSNVLVKTYRIKSHYSMGGMSYLNKTRRAIVDRVYQVLHGEKRKIG